MNGPPHVPRALVGPDLRIREANEDLALLAGLPAPDAAGRPLADVLPAGAGPTAEAVARRAMARGEAAEDDADLPEPLGRWRVRAEPSGEGALVSILAERAAPFGPGPSEASLDAENP